MSPLSLFRWKLSLQRGLLENTGDGAVTSPKQNSRGGWSEGAQIEPGVCLSSLRQGQQDVLNQHGADHHFLTVDRQLGGALFSGHHGDQHQAAAGHRSACKPVDRMFRRRNRRTEVKAAKKRAEVRLKTEQE